MGREVVQDDGEGAAAAEFARDAQLAAHAPDQRPKRLFSHGHCHFFSFILPYLYTPYNRCFLMLYQQDIGAMLRCIQIVVQIQLIDLLRL